MTHRTTDLRGRLLSIFAIALCIILLAIVASTFNYSISTTVAPQPPQSTPTSGISLLALLFLLLSAFLALLGIAIDPPSGQPSGGSVLDLVFTILQVIYQHRLVIIAIASLLTVIGLFYQYRYHLAVPRVFQLSSVDAEPTSKSPTATTNADWPPDTESEPESVQKAWIAMVQHIDDIEKPSSRTPTEWQQIAVDAGLPTDAVETITTSFCATQYGNVSETVTRRRRVQAALDKIDGYQEVTDE